jgi:hypothetical protein
MHLGGALHRQKKSVQTIHIAGILSSTAEHPHEADLRLRLCINTRR